LIPAPVWVSPTKKQLGKPRVWKPWNVRMPRRQYSDSPVPPRPTRSTPTEVSMLLRSKTTRGVRWKTCRLAATAATGATHCSAVAPVPMMPTRLSASPGRPPPVRPDSPPV